MTNKALGQGSPVKMKVIQRNSPMEIRPEAELLLRSARAHLDPGETNRIVPLLQKELDWVYLKEMAFRHGVTQILYQFLKSYPPDIVPKSILTQLRRHSLSIAARGLVMT